MAGNDKVTVGERTPPSPAKSGFVVEASHRDPGAGHGFGGEGGCSEPTREELGSRIATNRRARFFLNRGYWVEVYDADTRELLAGPINPGLVAPGHIV